jgi:hypothetical protein
VRFPFHFFQTALGNYLFRHTLRRKWFFKQLLVLGATISHQGCQRTGAARLRGL